MKTLAASPPPQHAAQERDKATLLRGSAAWGGRAGEPASARKPFPGLLVQPGSQSGLAKRLPPWARSPAVPSRHLSSMNSSCKPTHPPACLTCQSPFLPSAQFPLQTLTVPGQRQLASALSKFSESSPEPSGNQRWCQRKAAPSAPP